VLFECLAGHKPYQANDAYAVALMHVTEPVPQLPEHVAWLQPLIEGLMAKNPDQRFPNGEAYVAALDRLLMDHPQADATAQQAARKRNTLKSITPLPGSVPAARDDGDPRGPRLSTGAMAGIAVAVLIAVVAVGWFVMHRNPAPIPVEPTTTTTQPVTPPTTPQVPMQTQEENQATAAVQRLDLPTLLSRGDEYLAYGEKNFGEKLDFPAGENAIDMYREALRRDSSNAQAKSGLQKIAAYYEKAARDALKMGLFTATDEFIDKGLRADPNNQDLAGLKVDLAKKEQEH
jgi:hypothetical protein